MTASEETKVDNVAEKLESVKIKDQVDDKKQASKQAKSKGNANANANAKSKPKLKAKGNQNPLFLDPQPEFIKSRIELFEQLKAEYDKEVALKPRVAIQITLKDGKTVEGVSWETSPLEIANGIGKSFGEKQCISRVNGELWDLERPLETDSKVEFLDFESEDGRKVFHHSSAHILGESCELNLGCLLCHGPPVSDGFFYDFAVEDSVTPDNFSAIENVAKVAVKQKQKFERLVVSKENLLKMFEYSKYKTYMIQTKVADNSSTTVYRCGPLIDLCMGPHLTNTGKVKSFKILKNSSSYFLADSNNDSLQRIYGISFPDKKQMTEHLKFLAEAASRDHRKIGREQELFLFNEMSPGSCFWLPHGARIYNSLVELLRSQYKKRGYEEVITPNMFNSKLWEISGHWGNYKENMFTFDVEKEHFGLKPMNCPGHCIMFKSRERSYRELPWRVADFGVIHRNEFSGALSGLTRVRRFQQDDAHIFCTEEQIGSEISNIFEFLKYVYGIFGFEFKMELSTRPEKYVGEIETWNSAEAKLAESLDAWGGKWELNEGDGAFYGPKIDIMISDALRRWHQCATIQLDFQLPNRFGLEYNSEDSNKVSRPVMIHRAIYGSIERMTAILTEHYAGKWPFWLSPRQILVVPVGVKYFEYAQQVQEQLKSEHGFWADVDVSGNTLQKKIRTGQMQRYNFIFIVGEQEMESKSVNIRNRDIQDLQTKNEMVLLADVIPKLVKLKEDKRDDNIL
ncbi:threonyl-tRNA synthetase [Ascoidea rubescens DSM 1968]|uniref:Threonine--tRNA ligase, cytoplasmic n=1 Tax=Ascoidea rubescens DSM 1968 TaxID=1344418 RepID=A0A1D2V8N1_9ASCO|nr:threonyl-tRNA synthetase [Ascoidea rubescens DSM 1968]XP_020044319.1 threonyl-tRNA synthetase [Ascoidea rubescens DSM 1968]XP_020044931.1 threonyl-tRNA synthetase [Ascoidea rubescens DSM 1968]ODV57828.1 threonyl-tRNA synthetase [Ascoidea rubescens DSM 1968]ODV58012.1 threonyl-tRNA synthetase [Ascoidea rubescens DSM 1968]ODV58624.1 threonyl-tRNA synthetase [Ascoidea rubescens DSM 1968]